MMAVSERLRKSIEFVENGELSTEGDDVIAVLKLLQGSGDSEYVPLKVLMGTGIMLSLIKITM
jgi:hypothetical protein